VGSEKHRAHGDARFRLADPTARSRYLQLWLRSVVWFGLSFGLGYLLIRFVNPVLGLIVAFALLIAGLRYRWRADLIVFPQWRGRHRKRR
jgi:hypothetical protein